MGISGDLKLTEVSPADLLPVIQRSGILNDRQLTRSAARSAGASIRPKRVPWPSVCLPRAY